MPNRYEGENYWVTRASRYHFRYQCDLGEAHIPTDINGDGSIPLDVDRIEWVEPTRRLATKDEAALIAERALTVLEKNGATVRLEGSAESESAYSRLSPQEVTHSTGYNVRVGPRTHVEYKDGDRIAVVEADPSGKQIDLFVDQVFWASLDGPAVAEVESALIVGRVEAALTYMSMPFLTHRACRDSSD